MQPDPVGGRAIHQDSIGRVFRDAEIDKRVLLLYDEVYGKARGVLDCWSIVGHRLKVVKDIRVMIGRMVGLNCGEGEKEDAKKNKSRMTINA